MRTSQLQLGYCENCEWWQGEKWEEGRSRRESMGSCKRFPPVRTSLGTAELDERYAEILWAQPLTHPFDMCAEFQAREDEP